MISAVNPTSSIAGNAASGADRARRIANFVNFQLDVTPDLKYQQGYVFQASFCAQDMARLDSFKANLPIENRYN